MSSEMDLSIQLLPSEALPYYAFDGIEGGASIRNDLSLLGYSSVTELSNWALPL
jgi:hypothetical protein